MLLLLVLAVVCLVAAKQKHQEPMVTLKRAVGVPPNHTWLLIHQVPQRTLWMGIMMRDTITGAITAFKVEWPACVSGQRTE